jgi:hypothetical protein
MEDRAVKRLLSLILSMIILLTFSLVSCGKDAAENRGGTTDAGTAATSAGVTGLPGKSLPGIAWDIAMSVYLTEYEGSELHVAGISFAGDAGEVVGKIREIKGYDFTFYAFAVNSDENLAELGEFGRKSGVRDFDPQKFDAEFFETGFILVTTFWMSSQGYGFEFSVGECDGELININKVQTYPSLLNREWALRPCNGLYVVFSIIPVKYSGQTVYYTETIAP